MAEVQILGVIGKLRPRVKRERRVDLDDLADEIAVQSGFDRGDARDFAYKFAHSMAAHLKFGETVKLGDMGCFHVACDKDLNLRVHYRATKSLKGELATDFRGSFVRPGNAGLDEEGYAQLWLEENPLDTVVMRDGSLRTG